MDMIIWVRVPALKSVEFLSASAILDSTVARKKSNGVSQIKRSRLLLRNRV
jgi:hypothetical protein